MTEIVTKSDEEIEPERFKKLVTIGGWEVWFYSLSDGQVLQLAHESRVLQSSANGDVQRLMKSLDRIFMIFKSVVKDEADAEWIEDSMAQGTIDLLTLIELTRELMGKVRETDQPRVRRARAKR